MRGKPVVVALCCSFSGQQAKCFQHLKRKRGNDQIWIKRTFTKQKLVDLYSSANTLCIEVILQSQLKNRVQHHDVRFEHICAADIIMRRKQVARYKTTVAVVDDKSESLQRYEVACDFENCKVGLSSSF
ncbi:hypothetical protein GJ496_011178 [Pomphorhynchus laevis]|nr:hypothetical protein GJ496_011178 [Pomphorhynchus laevis]